MRYRLFFIILFILVTPKIFAQQKWGLQQCIEYALANNIAIKQSAIQASIAGEEYKERKLGQYPSVNFNSNGSFNSGSSQNTSTFALTTQSFVSATFQLQASAQIFNWYSKQNLIQASHWQAEAAKASAENTKNNIILDICNAYLQTLLTRAQDSVAAVQLRESQSQLGNTRKLVNAGSLPELNATELEAQVSTDSANMIAAEGNITQAILTLKSYMNMDAGAPFDVDQPPVDLIPVENIADLQPEAVYALAVANLPQERVDVDNLKAALYNAKAAKAGLYPTFSAFGNLGSRYNNLGADAIGYSLSDIPLGEVGGSNTFVYPYTPIESKTSFTRQLNENFYQTIGIGLSVPIFSGGSLRGAWKIAEFNAKNYSLQLDANNQTLKQNIYQAYTSATVALNKFNAEKKTLDATERSFSFAKKRYEVGLLGSLELITDENTLFSTRLQYLQDQFDYVFKMKVLEFYKGQGLKL